MNLCVFLAIGESWEDFKSKGQDSLLLNNNYAFYSENFANTDVLSYGSLAGELLEKVTLHGNQYRIHRYLYTFFMPLLQHRVIRSASVLRGMQLSSVIPILLAKAIFRKKVVINYGYDYARTAISEKKYFQAYVYKILEFCTIRFIDALIVTTPQLKQKAVALDARRIVLIPNSINTDIFKKYPKVPKRISVLFVGRLEKQKNLLSLLSAISDIPQKRKLRVMFIGTGSQKERLIQYAQSKSINLKIINSVPNAELPKYYNNAKVFVLNSQIEGHPKALLEAMSCQLPVIGANTPGINNLIYHSKNGLLVNNQKELKNAIILLLSNKRLCIKLGAEARKTVLKNYEQKSTWKKEIALLKELAQ